MTSAPTQDTASLVAPLDTAAFDAADAPPDAPGTCSRCRRRLLMYGDPPAGVCAECQRQGVA
jgi:hypothetical protein